MKQNLILVALALPILGFSQIGGFVGDGATVKVKPNTTMYVGGDMTVQSAANVSNDGNINVRGNFTSGNTTDGSNFINTWTSATEYGQLIINQNATVSGKITHQFRLSDTFDYHALGYPFVGNTADDLRAQSGTTATFNANQQSGNNVFNPQRWRAPIWTWNNATFSTDNPGENQVLTPLFYHAVNGYDGYYSFNSATPNNFHGKPNNGPNNNPITSYSGQIQNNRQINVYGEAYGSYIEDVTMSAPDGWTTYANPSDLVTNEMGYGENVYYYGNPYTSNICLDLDANITHIWQTTNMTYVHTNEGGPNEGVGATNTSTMELQTDIGAGDSNVACVRPFHTFGIKTNGDDNIAMNFSDAIKTFIPVSDSIPSYTYNRGGAASDLYQLQINLFDNNDAFTGNRFYLAAHTSFEAAGAVGNEAFNTWLGDKTGFTLKQENADGTVSPTSHGMYINGFNTYSYVAKPLYAAFQNNGTMGSNFTIKANFNENLLNSSNKFYFEDAMTGYVTEVTPGFTYSFTESGSTTDRFRFYWNGLPETLGADDVSLASQTIVYKDGKEHKVRFDRTWNSADIFVYSISGQLVHTAKNLPTNQDYLLPLHGQTTMYVVKAVSNEGVVVTKKVIK
ncbi:MAG: T9SS type A sorting domain-containing protein [Weeksellaceae bacterium]|nr:T9SS type A sorting domain-containing protein [Weeksellaceae bacterium]